MKRKNGEGTWGFKTVGKHTYSFYRDPDGKYYYGKTDKEVRAKVEAQKRANMTAKSVNDVAARPSTTFYNYVTAYIESIKLTLEPYTYYNYTKMVDNLVKGHKIAHKQLAQLTPDMLTNYYNELSENYALGTIVSIRKILKGPIMHAEYDGLIKQSTFAKSKMPKEKYCKPAEEAYIPEEDDCRTIEDLCFAKTKKSGNYKMGNNGLFFVVLLHTGMRIGELIALRWSDVDMKRRQLDVNKSASFRKVGNHLVYDEKDPKSRAGFRVIPFDDTVYNIFTYLLENYPSELNNRTGYVFVNKNHTHMAKSTLEQSFNTCIRDKMGIEKMTPHSLRHAYGSYLARNHVNPRVIMELMGHSRLNITFETYVKAYEDERIEAANLFDSKKDAYINRILTEVH